MKKVCFIGKKTSNIIGEYEIHYFSPQDFFQNTHWSLYDFLTSGLNGYYHNRALTYTSTGVDRLYREKNPAYMKLIQAFVEAYKDFDIIVMDAFNFLHPEVIQKYLTKPVKILGFIDDPYSTYARGIPYLWAFDGAFYISPSYVNELSFSENLKKWGAKNNYFKPLVVPLIKDEEITPDFFKNRTIDICYVGYPTDSKVDRLKILKKHFKDRLVVHGRWPLKGNIGFLRGFLGKKFYPYHISPIQEPEKLALYKNLKIGFNMHVSDLPSETGNVRMYEIPAHGAMLLCDKAANKAHELIFNTNEAVYYNNIYEAIELAEYYLKHDEKRIQIAQNGYHTFWSKYEYEKNLLRFLDWASLLKNHGQS